MAVAVFLCLIAALILFLHKRLTSKQNVWKNKGIPFVKPIPYIGNMLDNVLRKKSSAEVINEVCSKFKYEPLVGFFNFTKPTLLVNDIDYAETILVKEFSSFMNRMEHLELKERRPLDKHLFFIGGSEWKAVRSKFTPVFTTGKLKGMLPEIERIFDKTIKDVDTSKAIPLVDLIEKFTIRVRASCVFGIDLSKSDSEVEFLQKAKDMTKMSFTAFIQTMASMFFPRLAKKFNLSFFGAENENYFVGVLLNSFKERKELKIVKNDFVQTLMELKIKGKVEVQHWAQEDEFLKTDDKHSTTDTVEIDDDILVSQSFIFLVAGLETLISTLTMLLVELSRHPDVLDKLRREVDSVIGQHKEFSYQALKDMEYLDYCIKETLRLYTPAEVIVRHCCKSFTFPNGVTIDKGTDVFIPCTKYHTDPNIYSDPMDFKPERFINDSFPAYAYLPFGYGPRICIGLRFAMLEMKMFMSKLVLSKSFKLDPRTEIPVRTDKWYILRKAISPIFMKFSTRAL